MALKDTLRRVIDMMEGFSASLPPLSSSHVLSPLSLNIPPLRLAKSTSSFQSEMLQNGLLPQIYKLASSKAAELETIYQESYRQICHRLVSLPRNKRESSVTEIIHNLRSTFETLYEQKDLSRILADALKTKTSFTRHSEECPLPRTSHRRAFNHGYTPFLEKYFGYNAYPSARDRLLLARKTMMTARQIEVWFQNHRNRAKKDGKVLRKCMDPIAKISLDSLVHRPVDDSVIPDNEPMSGDESLDEESEVPSQTQAHKDILSPSAPPHAFPTKYPPVGAEDPFAIGDKHARFPSPSWRRRPTTTQVQYPSISIDELVISFASKLNLHDVNKDRNGRKRHFNGPWYAATVTVPSIAPHPALVLTPVTRLHIPPSFSTPMSGFPPQVVTPRPISGIPSAAPTHLKASLRKIAPLPQRLPSNAGSSTLSLQRSCISGARVSSSSSLSSSPSRSSSWSSVASITPITPPTCHVVLSDQEFVQTLGGYLMTSNRQLNQIESQHLGLSISEKMTKRMSLRTPSYKMSSLLSDQIPNYLEAQS